MQIQYIQRFSISDPREGEDTKFGRSQQEQDVFATITEESNGVSHKLKYKRAEQTTKMMPR